jgi:two-component system chemotaxis response regulator CheB
MSQAAPSRPAIRVLVVDDSAFMRTALCRMIASDSDFEIAGTAHDGADALEKIGTLNPDILTLDLEMPGMDGLETLRHVMRESPRPVIIVSAISEAQATFNALTLGAFDYVPKQLSASTLDITHIREDLLTKLRAAAQSRNLSSAALCLRKPPRATGRSAGNGSPHSPAVVAIGASTGGPRALQEILPRLPRDLSVPIVVVQHMPPGFTGPFSQRLDALCSVAVREANHREPLRAGVVYIAPAGRHMTVEGSPGSEVRIALDSGPADCPHVPSVDIMMKSVARTYGELVVAVILTGMGSDGVEGMRAIHLRGGITIGQDKASCVVYGMPRACAEQGILTHVVPLSQIPAQIIDAIGYRKRA